MTRADGKRDRDEMFVEYTICPVCKVVVSAWVNIRHDRYLRKRCHLSAEFRGPGVRGCPDVFGISTIQ